MKLKNGTFRSTALLTLFLLTALTAQVDAICPTRFYALAVTVQRAAELDIYFSRTQVETAADCAIFCGKRQFCRSAVYNHDTKSCALSYDKIVECNTQKQRYNTFHLTTDGADSISVITCVELCKLDKPKFQDTKPSTLFSRNEPYQTVKSANSAAQFLSEIKSDLKNEFNNPNHGKGQSSQFVAVSRGRSRITENETLLPPEIIHSETPSKVIIEALQRLIHEVNESRNETSMTKLGQSGQFVGRVEAETQLNTQESRKFGTEESKNEANLLGIKSHQAVKNSSTKLDNSTLQLTDHRSNKQQLSAKDLITSEAAKTTAKQVMFKAQPLQLQETLNGTTSLNAQSEFHHLAGIQDQKSGGFFKWLRPNEMFTLPPEVNLPPEVAKLVPELLNAVGRGEVGRLRGKSMSFEITEKDTVPKESSKKPNSANQQELKRTLTRFAKIKVEDKETEEERKSKELAETERIKEVFNSVASNLDQIVINGRLLSVDEIKSLMQKESLSSTTTTTPKPWKPASQLFGASDEDDEDDQLQSTTTTASTDQVHRDSKPNGFLNTFLIQGISSMIHGENDANSAKKTEQDFLAVPATKALPFLTTTVPTTTTAFGPIVCYRQIPQQILLYAAFQTLNDISLNECRCRCAETWLNFTGNDSSHQLRCKSVLYNEANQECSLNQGDHNGKYDLIYNKFVDYHYVSCDIKYLLSAARRVCAKVLPSLAQNLSSQARAHRPDFNENTSDPLLRDAQHRSADDDSSSKQKAHQNASLQKLILSEVAATSSKPTISSTTLPVLKSNLLSSVTQKILTVKSEQEKTLLDGTSSTGLPAVTQTIATITTEAPTTTIKNTRHFHKTPSDDSDLLIQEINVVATSTPTTQKATTTTLSSLFVTSKTDDSLVVDELETTKLPESVRAVNSAERKVTTSLKEKLEIFVSSETTTPHITSTTTTSYDLLTISGYTDGCFEVIAGFMMQSTAGGLERDVESLADCECYCVSSLSSKRYSFQCVSATYYPAERDCILNLDSREVRPDAFMRQEIANENVTYLGLICPQEKAAQIHTLKGQCKREHQLSTTTSATTTTTVKPVNSDECFLELPNYVLEGTALAVETNVSVEECKCYCVDAERRYGTDCQSLEYYYDSQTCLLNKENRISDPHRFNYDAHGLMHSYFDYRCHAEKMTLAVYVEQICSYAIDLKISDIQPTTDASLDVESDDREQANEVRLVTETQLPETSTQRVKILKFISENEEEGIKKSVEAEKSQEKPRKKSKPLRQKTTKTSLKTLSTPRTPPHFAPSTTMSLPLLTTKKSVDLREENVRRELASVRNLAEIEELEGEEELKQFEATSTTKTPTTTTATTTTQRTTVTTQSFTTKKLITSTTEATVATTTQKPYPPVGECRYSALYQTGFNGERMIRRFKVQNATQCFAGCHWERCRSANMIHSGGPIKYCELYRDSIVDFRRTDVLYFDRNTVHFDSINCNETLET